MFLRVMQWTSHCVPWQIEFVGVLFGLWPRFCCFWFSVVCFAVPSGETQVWLGDLRVVVFGCFCGFCVLLCSICLLKMDISCPCTNVFPTAYAHVRTEPLARHRPNSRKKKRVCPECRSYCCHFHLRSCFTFPFHPFFVSHHSRCDPALSVFASKCLGVMSCLNGCFL